MGRRHHVRRFRWPHRRHHRPQLAIQCDHDRGGRRHRLVGHKGQQHSFLPNSLRDPQPLARHGARTSGLCFRPHPALRHGRLGVLRYQTTVPGFPVGSVTSAGWTVGGGLEVGIVPRVSVKAEYLYVDLADYNCGFNCGLAASGTCRLTPMYFAAVSTFGLAVRNYRDRGGRF